MKNRIGKALVGCVPAVILFSLGGGEAFAMKCVKPDGSGGCSTTIQGAVTAAISGETIRIFPGNYAENVSIGTAGVTLLGQGTWPGAVVVSPSSGTTVSVNAPNVTLNNLTIKNGDDCVIATAPGVKLIDTAVAVCSATGISASAGDLLIQNSSVRQTQGGGIVATGDGVRIVSSLIQNAGASCIEVDGNAARVTGNQILGCGLNGVTISGYSAVVNGNDIRGAGGHLINIEGAGARVRSNQLEGAIGAIMKIGSDSPVITDNTGKNSASGIDVFCASCLGGQLTNNAVNNVFDCPGFKITGETPGLVVERNSSLRNSDAGFRLSGPGMVVKYNQAHKNGASGIELNNLGSDSGTLLLGNRATGNAVDGILIGSGVTGTKVRQNTARSNGHMDFYNLGTGTILGTGFNKNFFDTVGP